MQQLAAQARDPQPGPAPSTDAGGLQVTPSGRVLVDVYVNGPVDAARTALEQQGMQVTADSSNPGQHIVSGWLPPARAPDVATLGITRSVRSVLQPRVNGVGPGAVTSLGDLRMHGPAARSAAAVNGAGVTVGVISDSFNVLGGMAAAQASSDLPPNVSILAEGDANGADEGQAMGELLYDTAPGVTNMLFATGFAGSASGKADNIKKLVDAGARVITDDTAFLDEPFFQDGVVEQAVDAARDRGVAYFAAAGNSGRDAWEGDFRPSGSFVTGSQERNDFDPAAGVDTRQSLGTAPANASITIISQWDEPWNKTLANAFTLRVFAGTTLVATDSNAAKIPEVALQYTNTTGSSKALSMELVRTGSGPAPHLKTMFYPGYNAFAIGHDTQSPTIGPDAPAAAGAISVAAVDEKDPGLDTPEGFSSRGPLTHYFDAAGVRQTPALTRAKPEIAAPDGVPTWTFGRCLLPDNSDCFFGTSAASPAAAGVAALLWSANPALPLSELRRALTAPANAIDCSSTAGQPDTDCGAGFLQADRAIADIDPTPPVVTAHVDPAAPDGDGGWYHSDVDVSWTHADPDTPISSVTGCDPVEVTTDSIRTLTCAVSSAGGTTSIPLTIRRDTTPPSAPDVTGIAAQSYTTATVPPSSAIGCQATDGASGISRCTVSGYSAAIGAHQLTATATDRSGLSTGSTLDYTVTAVPPVPPKAASRLSIGAVSLGALRSRGLTLSVRTARASTKLVATLTARLPGDRRSSTIGSLTRTVAKAGTQSLRVALSRRARTALARSSKVTVSATVVATAAGATKVTLRASRSVRR